MAHATAAQTAAVIGALGVPVLLLLRGRLALLGGLALLAAAETILALSIVPEEDLRRLWATPLHVLAAVLGIGAVAALTVVAARWPGVVPVTLVAAAPFRLEVELGGQEAFLLLPLYAALAAGALALAWRVLRGEQPSLVTPLIAVPASAFVALSAVSLLWSRDLRAGTIQLLFFLFPFVVVLAVVARSPLARWTPRALATTVVALASLFAAVGIWQAWTKRLFFAPDLEVANAYTTFFRVTSLFKDPSLYGRHLVYGIGVLLVALLLRRARVEIAAPLVALLFAGLYFSYSQSSLVTLFIVVVAVALSAGDLRTRRAVALAVAGCVLVGAAYVAVTVRGESARKITSGRSELIRSTAEVFARHPLAGVGVGSQPLAAREEGGRTVVRRNASHTTPLTVAAELGLPGVAVYLLFLGGIAAALLTLRRRDRPLVLGLGVVFLTLLVHSLVYSGFFEDPLLWGALGMVAAVLALPAAQPLPSLRELWRPTRRQLVVATSALAVVSATAGVAAAFAFRKPPEGKLDTKLEGVSVVRPHERAPKPVKRKRKNAPPADDRCWTEFGGNPQRTLALPSRKLGKPTRHLWVRGLKGYIEYPPTYCDGALYVNTYRGDTWAFDAATGQRLWRRRSRAAKPSSPAIAGKRLIVASKDGSVTALARETGRALWRLETGAIVESSPVVVDDTVYFGTTSGRVFAAAVRTGRVRWAYNTGGRINSSPSLFGDRLCITTYAGSIFCLDRRTGRKLWSRYLKRDTFRYESFYASASTDGRRLYTVARSGRVYSLSARTGKLLWTQRVGGLGYSTPAVADGRVFVGGFDGLLRAFNSSNGRLLWRRWVGGRVLGPSLVVGDLVFVSTLEQRTYALRAANGRIVWQIGMGKYAPGIATENHYYFSLNGILIAFRAQGTPRDVRRAEDAFFARGGKPERRGPKRAKRPRLRDSG